MNVKLVKLASGEEVISNVEYIHNGERIRLIKPVRLVATQEGLGMVAWPALGSQDKIELDRKHVMFAIDTNDDIINTYQQATGGIVTPGHQLVT